ncbi:MAG: cell wall-binding repeat-containing protein [Peptostreptococcus sp.]|uniref:cell wall-binding repeat-containing protein n=1 Tax=Peptostreptococcus sp. TaxID=1262 RepID=UPI002FC9280F
MKKIISTLLCSAFLLSTAAVSNVDAANIDVQRISGVSRYSTPVEISKAYFESAPTVVLASGEGYADALVGGSLVSQEKIPMLLTRAASLPKETKDELLRLKTKKVYILGGPNTVSKNVENSLKTMNIQVKRLAGKNRMDTAGEIARERYTLNAKGRDLPMGDSYVGINAYNYADALVAGSLVGQMRGEVLSYIYPYSQSNPMPYYLVFGGTASIPSFDEYTQRIAGKNRFETSVESAKNFKTLTGKDLKTVILVDGTNYPDALAASTVAGKEDATIITTTPNNLYKESKKFIRNNGIEKVIIIGGEKSVSKYTESEINDSEDVSSSTLGGWKVENNNKYYYKNGSKLTGWQNIEGSRYYFNSSGVMQTGWHFEDYNSSKYGKINNARYYLMPDGRLAEVGREIDGWITTKDGVSEILSSQARKNIMDQISKDNPQLVQEINNKNMILFKDSNPSGASDVYHVSKMEDYWSVPYENGIREGSNEILYTYSINRYTGDVIKK